MFGLVGGPALYRNVLIGLFGCVDFPAIFFGLVGGSAFYGNVASYLGESEIQPHN